MTKCFIIAEVGVNHNGSLELARQLVDLAIWTGADAVKFQTFDPTALATTNAPKADYQLQSLPADASMLKMLQALHLGEAEHYQLQEYCQSAGIEFLSTPFDMGSLFFLVEKLGLTTIKIGSGDITNAPLLLEVAKKGCSVILSTGMSTLGDIENALAVLAFGYLNPGFPVSYEEIIQHFHLKKPWDILKEKVSLLHCVSNYPASYEEVHLSVLSTLRHAFGLKIGYSDHTLGIEIPIAAVALGSEIIEKHLTLDRSLPGPDHKASIEGQEFKKMVDSIRNVELAIGNCYKAPSFSEVEMAKIARRSIVANKHIPKNHKIQLHDIAFKRPAMGLSPMFCWDVLGTQALQTYEVEQYIAPFLLEES